VRSGLGQQVSNIIATAVVFLDATPARFPPRLKRLSEYQFSFSKISPGRPATCHSTAHWKSPEPSLIAGRKPIPIARRALLFVGLIAAGAGRSEAQIGLSSGVARVVLMARAPVQGSIQGILSEPGIGLSSAGSQGRITLQVSANTGYRLLVRATDRSGGSRIWLRSVNGKMEEVTEATAVIVVDDAHPTGVAERRVEYRVDGVVDEPDQLPVRYELQINPVL
jgi:hypothetical protein